MRTQIIWFERSICESECQLKVHALQRFINLRNVFLIQQLAVVSRFLKLLAHVFQIVLLFDGWICFGFGIYICPCSPLSGACHTVFDKVSKIVVGLFFYQIFACPPPAAIGSLFARHYLAFATIATFQWFQRAGCSCCRKHGRHIRVFKQVRLEQFVIDDFDLQRYATGGEDSCPEFISTYRRSVECNPGSAPLIVLRTRFSSLKENLAPCSVFAQRNTDSSCTFESIEIDIGIGNTRFGYQ